MNDNSITAVVASSNEHGQSPVQRVTMPEYVEWHMILDQELTTISRPETGIIGSIGFMALGAVFGLAGTVTTVYAKLKQDHGEIINGADLINVIAFSSCVVLSLVCLVIFALNRWRNRGLAAEIRKR